MCGYRRFCWHHEAGFCCRQPGGFQERPFHRRFPSREERIVRLEEPLKDIQAEAKAVEERLAQMKAAG